MIVGYLTHPVGVLFQGELQKVRDQLQGQLQEVRDQLQAALTKEQLVMSALKNAGISLSGIWLDGRVFEPINA